MNLKKVNTIFSRSKIAALSTLMLSINLMADTTNNDSQNVHALLKGSSQEKLSGKKGEEIGRAHV